MREKREGGRKGEEGGEREEERKEPFSGDRREKSPVQLNKNCAVSIRTACCDRGGPFLQVRRKQLCVWVIGASVTIANPGG